jgi:uncharacterized protein YkwD
MGRRVRWLLAAATLAAAVVAGPAGAAVESGARVTPVAPLEAAVLAELNALRKTHGLAPLRPSPRLSASAATHSRAMAKHGFFGHESADGSPFWRRVERFYASEPYRYWWVGENLLWSRTNVDAKEVLRTWLSSPSHREVLMAPRWREVGVSGVRVDSAPGRFGGHDVVLLTADFGVRR